VSAAVRGGRRYHVNVIVREQQLGASCDCAAYKAGVYCQHIWATLRAVESRHTTASGKKAEPPAGEHLTLTDLATMSLPQPGGWRDALDRLARDAEFAHEAPWHEQPDVEVELAYRIDVAATLRGQRLAVEIGERRRPAGGEWGELEASELRAYEIADLPDPLDREILAMLLGAEPESGPGPSRYTLTEPLRGLVLPALCRTGRCRLLLASGEESGPLRWEPEEWQFWMAVTIDRKSDEFAIAGALRRGRKRCALSKPILLLSGGLAFFPDRIAPLDDSGAFRWIGELRRAGTLRVPRREADRLLRALLAAPRTRPRLKLPAQLRFEELRLPPVPVLSARARLPGRSGRPLECELGFDYGGVLIEFGAPGWAVWHGGGRRLLVRDEEKERAATAILAELDLRPASVGKGSWAVPVRRFAEVVRTLVSKGWRVRADGHDYLAASGFDLRVASGIDWFDLEGGASFGDGRTIAIPRLLKALNSGELAVELDDGSLGLVPEQWLAQHALLADFAEVADDRLRFRRNQVALLDALLASQPEANTDRAFRRARAALDRFDGVGPVDPTPGFVGKLRDYQREGLGWMHFLRDFGFGGCLADDMGLGKTVQVLALLEGRRSAKATGRSRRKPSLVVVPRSLVFNWKQEAERFAPRLRVLDHTGPDRAQKKAALDGWDVVLTTYGTLRRDALLFRDARFDYAILDEAQAIKNPRTASAKAARLLTAEHRLVLSGTPIENHLGELWSLFEFLNPGMLGRAAILTPGSLSEPDEQQRALLARALKPFILRRTKDKVARDLPPRTEQTLYCEPGPEQRQMCDELREHYRHQLMVQIDSRGLGRSKIKILEALLRMRQAACHPGLLDPALQAAPSAKLDVLLPRLVEVLDEGHKALVFSQFTSFLAILRKRLDEQGLPYEYLDGRTRDRAARVQRFQEDPKCPLFLISLKAGGLGLNLTAAEYVFLLDPWWNPAAEAQAVDRTHRIGQHRHVFAYRLITRDTIEERVLELQKRKRSLADAILTADEGMLRGLERADLEELLR
jgi:superfamily II DNA or RNA helicase